MQQGSNTFAHKPNFSIYRHMVSTNLKVAEIIIRIALKIKVFTLNVSGRTKTISLLTICTDCLKSELKPNINTSIISVAAACKLKTVHINLCMGKKYSLFTKIGCVSKIFHYFQNRYPHKESKIFAANMLLLLHDTFPIPSY